MKPVMGQYADWCAHVWSMKTGKYYDLLNPEHRAKAATDEDDFVRELAKYYSPDNGQETQNG